MQDRLFFEWRRSLFDFLHGIVQRENMHICSFWLAVFLFNKYAETHSFIKEEMQLIGLTILVIASKVEDVNTIDYHEVSFTVERSYSVMDFVRTELRICCHLNFDVINCETGYHYLKKYIAQLDSIDGYKEHLAFYYAESNLKEEVSVECPPPLYASVALFLALIDRVSCSIRDIPIWTEKYVGITSYTKEMIFPYALSFLKNLKRNPFCEGRQLLSVQHKYSRETLMAVSEMTLPDLEEENDDDDDIPPCSEIILGCQTYCQFL
jgi:hypothetical protein